jgi:chromosomal replication initiation ATPase DnaA
VAIKPPSEALLAALLAKAFADRQLRTEPSLHGWLLARLPREAAAMAEAAARLDRAALATGWRITPRLAQAALGDLLAEGDDRETVAPAPSPPGGGLL